MKKYVAASNEILNGNAGSFYIGYTFFDQRDVQIIWVFHSATLPELIPTTWEQVVKKLPNPESIVFADVKGNLKFCLEEKRWTKL